MEAIVLNNCRRFLTIVEMVDVLMRGLRVLTLHKNAHTHVWVPPLFFNTIINYCPLMLKHAANTNCSIRLNYSFNLLQPPLASIGRYYTTVALSMLFTVYLGYVTFDFYPWLFVINPNESLDFVLSLLRSFLSFSWSFLFYFLLRLLHASTHTPIIKHTCTNYLREISSLSLVLKVPSFVSCLYKWREDRG